MLGLVRRRTQNLTIIDLEKNKIEQIYIHLEPHDYRVLIYVISVELVPSGEEEAERLTAVARISYLQDGVILLLRPESFSFFLSYLNLVIPARFE